ncbi:MAG: Mu transposase C-terminal domain-containing protein [Ignavibacterium sp.]|jgi:putative transposase|uniref:Mu transposase C-terminal domain-containing protein n=1 Tax=Ignavibacterium sp. TaxID=2651167 RepID=UPI003297369F
MKEPFVDTQTKTLSENYMGPFPTFDDEGRKYGRKSLSEVGNDDKSIKNNDLQLSVKWISSSEGRKWLELTDRVLRYHCKQGHFVTRRVKMNGGLGYEISVESMFKYYESIGDWGKCEKILGMIQEISEIDGKEEEVDRASSVPTITTDEVLAKFQICKLLDEVILKADKKTIAVEKFVNSFNQGSYPRLFDSVGKISVRSVYRWYRDLRDSNWDISVFEKELKPTARTISNKEAEIIIPMLLNPNRPLVSEILKRAKQEFLKRGITLKSDVTYRRFIEDWTSRNIDLWTLGRYGMKAFNDKIMKDILRDKDRVEVGDIVVADGYTFNVMVINPITGRPQRMTLIMFFDYKSSMPLGREIMPTENVLAIASALRRTILLLGRFFGDVTLRQAQGDKESFGYIPKIAYMDNGRAFRAKYFRGIKDFRDSIVPGLFGKFGIETMYATLYHGQSKTIERWFKTLGEMERRLPAYTGTNIASKPAMLMRNEKLHQRLFDNTPITIDSLDATLEEYVKEYAEQPHQDGQYKGLCPAEVFMHSVNKIKSEPERLKGRLISKQELNYLMLSDETRTITKNGIRFRGNYYYNEEMPRIIGSRVIIKYDIWDDSEVIILDEKERYLFTASKDDVRYHPAARLLGSDEDVVLLQEALRKKQQMKNETVQIFKGLVEMQESKSMSMSKSKNKIKSESESMDKGKIKRNAFKEYMKLCGIESQIYKNPVEELLKRGGKK